VTEPKEAVSTKVETASFAFILFLPSFFGNFCPGIAKNMAVIRNFITFASFNF